MPQGDTSTAVAREAAWLSAYSPSDGLPALLSSLGGPFATVQPYRARSPRTRAPSLYVLRANLREERFANQRRMASYLFRLEIVWPLSNAAGSAEADQQGLDSAVELVLQRVGDLAGDKTHGGRFRSVAENPKWVEVEFTDPRETIAAQAAFECAVQYSADDFEITG